MMNPTPLPAFNHHCIWMFHDGYQAAVVNPGDAAPVKAALDAQGLQLAAILVTPHPAGRAGGVDALRSRLLRPVHGPAHENMPGPFEARHHADRIGALGPSVDVIDVAAARAHGARSDGAFEDLPARRPWKYRHR